ncbi:aminoglycoside phosphotransferase family protein [Methylovulum psychrotolerans]|uniref:aminoglycoside phosphotransferase family protein n=1 Tax=Methylovulum psychrotolerans TaxID=1704499 RepID=UPI0018E0079D|nr:aminoglycoside phosphotransferase family protein [Methylovulum psychrotolerans]
MPQNIVVSQPEDLTVAWAQRVVKLHEPHTLVTQVDRVSVEVGTTTRIRLAVTYQAETALPRRWFVKLPSLAWRARFITALPQLLETEIRFYQELAKAVPIALPVCLAAQSRWGLGSILVLADIEEHGALPGDPHDVLSAAQAGLVVDGLARFHARFWHQHGTVPRYRWLAGRVRQVEDHLGTVLAVPLMQQGLRRSGAAVPVGLHQAALHYARNRRRAMRFLSALPQTLVHHDCHPGNLFWQQHQAGLLDWQLVRIGEGVSDVAYFLATALEPEQRRLCETGLLARYARQLHSHGITDVDIGQLNGRYRAHLVYAFEAMVVTLAVGDMMPTASNLELIRRTATAVEDLDAFAALPI